MRSLCSVRASFRQVAALEGQVRANQSQIDQLLMQLNECKQQRATESAAAQRDCDEKILQAQAAASQLESSLSQHQMEASSNLLAKAHEAATEREARCRVEAELQVRGLPHDGLRTAVTLAERCRREEGI